MRKLILSAALTAIAAPAIAQDAALLLGVERYDNLRRVSGADDLVSAVSALRAAGFDVESSTNAQGAAMLPLLNRFVADTADADRVVVGLSGRFYTDGTRAWLLAADARRPSLFGMGNTAVSLDALLTRLGDAPGWALLVLGLDTDADANLGADLAEGLGDLDIPQGVTVVLTAPSGVDDVLAEAARPGGDVMAYVRDTRRVDALGYQPAGLVLTAEDVVVNARPQAPTDPSEAAWTTARETDTDDSYRDFIFSFPNSRYAPEARRRLDAIENDPVRLAEIVEDGLALTRNQRRDVQRDLTLLDYNTRGVDGIFGPGSRGAIRNWQQSNGFEQTSFLTREQINRIDAQASRKQAEIEAEEARAREEELRLDRAYWDETGAQQDAPGYRAYLERYPNGVFAAEAKAKLAEIDGRNQQQEQEQQQQQQNNAAQAQEERLNINRGLARLIESRLAQLGFNPGNVDGRFDSDTRGAIARYQTRRNLPATGYLSEPTLARLLADTF